MKHLLRPIFDRVVIKELEPDRVRRSGLMVPAGTDEPPPQHGIVVAVGPGLDWWEGAGIGVCPYCGDQGVPGPDACPVCGRGASSPASADDV
jgi:chaperonin GroES